MKALILSDSHRNFSCIRSAIEANPDINQIIFAGDVNRDAEYISDEYPHIPCAYVLGNNDFSVYGVPDDRLFELCGKRIFLTHGHKYSVKVTKARLIAEAKRCGADICIFGHTHEPYLSHDNDLWLVNPGSAVSSYAILTIENGTITIEHKKQ